MAGAAALMARGRRARAASQFKAKRVIVVGIGGGLRLRESLGMGDGATLPNLFGQTPLVAGFGSTPAGAPRIAPEYEAANPKIVVPAPLSTPLMTQGALITNLRYAEGTAGHLQGHATLISGAYNNIDNRADAHAPAPTLFELHRRQANAPATDAWYVSVIGGFYRALQASDSPDFGARYGGSFLSPPGVMSELLPIITSGKRKLSYGASGYPVISSPVAETAQVRKLTKVLDDGYAPWADDGTFRSTADENAAVEDHLATFFSDPTYRSYYPSQIGIGMQYQGGGLTSTPDALTVYHAEKILEKFKPSVLAITLLDIDAAHTDYNGYLRGQVTADACVRHLWEMIQSTDGLRDETAMLVLPEHGRHLFYNGQNPDSLGRSGLDHGVGDDGDRDTWMLALGPDFKPGAVLAPTGISQTGRTSGRYETIDMTMTAAAILGHQDVMAQGLDDLGKRPGLVIQEVLK
jgi:hypothetical protein